MSIRISMHNNATSPFTVTTQVFVSTTVAPYQDLGDYAVLQISNADGGADIYLHSLKEVEDAAFALNALAQTLRDEFGWKVPVD